jgi:acetyltransferase-like isoleucine patch superfamily enzyme
LLLAAVLPWAAKRLIYRRLGFEVADDARVGLSLITVDHMRLGAGARIGHLNAIRNLRHLELGQRGLIGSLNVVSAPSTRDRMNDPGVDSWPRTLVIGDDAHVINAHYLDVSGTITLERGARIAGRSTHVWTHQLIGNGANRVQEPAEVTIGESAYIGARATLLPGSRLAKDTTLGAGSVLTARASDHNVGEVLAGNPARVVASSGP